MYRSAVQLFLWLLFSVSTFAAEFTELPWNAAITRLSGDGSTIVGSRRVDGEFAAKGFVWTEDSELSDLPVPTGYSQFSPNVSFDGSVVFGLVCQSIGCHPALLEGGSDVKVVDLGEFDSGLFESVSNDGSLFVGHMSREGSDGNHAFTWSERDGLRDLGVPAGFNRSGAGSMDVSADGTVIATDLRSFRNPTSQPPQAHIWTNDTGFQSLGKLPNHSSSQVRAISSDGSVVVGTSGTYDNDRRAFRWTEESGMIDLGTLPNKKPIADDVTGDGSIVVGTASGGSNPDRPITSTFVWDAMNGMRDLEDVLEEEHGLSNIPRLDYWRIEISDDGKTIVGNRRVSNSENHAWMVRLDRPVVVTTGVIGDFNGNAELDVEDLDLLAAELHSDRNVRLFDVNSDNVVNADDREFWVGDLANTFMGDANLDHKVDFADFLELSQGFGADGGWAVGDFDGSGRVEFPDFLLLSENFGKSNVAAAGVPEPSSHLLLTIGLFGLCAQTRTRRKYLAGPRD